MLSSNVILAQGTTVAKPLAAPDASLEEEFTRVISVRELRDGRLLIVDDNDSRLLIGDFRSKTVRQIGRSGKGPGEYTTVGRLWPLNGDSTLMAEPYQMRWHTLLGDKIVSTVSDHPALRKVGNSILRGMDARRDAFGFGYVRLADGRASMSDSTFLYRLSADGTRMDTLARFPSPQAEMEDMRIEPAGRGGAPPPGKKTYAISISARHQVAVFPDGAVAVLRGTPYRVDWCLAGKACTPGPVLSSDRRRMSTADQAAYRNVLVKTARTRATEKDDMVGWPADLPPFHTPGGPDEGSFWPTSTGNVVIERVPSAASPSYTYDVIDRKGKRVAVVSVPANTFVIGFGSKSVYTIRVDDDGLQYLQRHAWTY